VTSQTAAAPARFDAVLVRARHWLRVAAGVRPAYVLGGLVAIQWVAVLALALKVRHNGWLYYAGGDQLWHYTGAYLLAHGHLPPAFVSYGWSVLMLPIALVAGPNLASALPAIVLLNTIVLLPVALLCVYGIAAQIAGRLFGYWAAALWVAIPYLGIVFIEPGYHQKYTELTLPQLVGLTSVPDFPSYVALLVGVYFCLRALDAQTWWAAAAAGLATGYSIAIKPSNAIFLAAPILTFLVLRWRALLPFALALALPLLTLALWKYRGLGELAAAPAEPMRLAGASDLLHRIHDTHNLNSWSHLHQVLLGLREHFWISRVIEWLPIAGTVGLAIRSRRGALLVVPWFVAFVLVKATYIPASIDDASFWRILMPAFPAYLLLAASVVLLVPSVRARPHKLEFELTGRRRGIVLSAAALLFVVAPLAVVAGTKPLHDEGARAVRQADSLVPVSGAIGLRAAIADGAVRLTWNRSPAGRAAVFYRILRSNWSSGGISCAATPPSAADDCRLFMEAPGATHATSFQDRPGRGLWTYRIGVSANWLNDTALGDVYVVSPPVTVKVG
jgi:hypothetical protein